ncbi:MAG: efflux RND transporter permease subunit [Caulobacteraceae bacterium]
MNGSGRRFPVSSWAIRNPIPVSVLFIALILAGLVSYNALAIKQYPNIEFPAVSVTITRNGAAPSEMEAQVTRPVENALAGLSNVETIASTDTQGVSSTFIQFYLGENLEKATEEVRSKVDATRDQLPSDIQPPIVQRIEFSSQPIITYAVKAPTMTPAALSWYIDNTVTRALQAQPGVAQVNRVGGADREINVLVDPMRMAAHGLTASEVSTALAAANVDVPGGQVSIGGEYQTLRVLGQAKTVDQIRNLLIPAEGGRFVRLADVAEVGDGSAEENAFALLDGKPVVGFQIVKTKLSSEISVEDKVDAEIAKLNTAHPGIVISKIVSNVDDSRESYSATLHTLLEGMLLAAFVVWLFLRDWRATMITAVAMPCSIIPTFAFIYLVGFSLNLVTLLGLTLVIGIVIDDAIVEIENIEKRVYAGMRPYQAAMEGGDQIGLAVVATTFALAAVFFPVGFMPGIPGQFFKEFGITVTVAVLFSLLVARLLTPLMAAYFLRPKVGRLRKPLPAFYTRTLTWALDHRWLAVFIGGVIFIASMALFIPLPKGVQPEANPNYFYINVQGPPGATIADMHILMNRIDHLLAKQPEVKSVFAEVGGGGGGGGNIQVGGGGANQGAAVAILHKHRKATVAQIRDRIRPLLRDIPGGRFTFDTSGFGAAGVHITLTSETGRGLEAAALELQREMSTMPGLADPRMENQPSGQEVVIRPRTDVASRLGVSATAIASAARIATVGDIDANVAKLDEGERRIPIRVRLPKTDRSNLAVIQNLRIPTASGGTTTLGAVADVSFQAGPVEIDRFDRKRNIDVDADLTGGTQLGDVLPKVMALPIMRHLPPGVGTASQGQEQALAQLASGFIVALLSGVGLVYAVMVLLFRSFFKPFVILSALPTAVGGAFVAMLLVGSPISIPSAIGFLMLMGLAAKNSILLVEYAIEREREGKTQREALMEACRERARPIFMTTMAMAAGMFPTTLALSNEDTFRQPMAVAVIGGLMTSTALSLVLVPVVYEFIDDIERWLSPRLSRLITSRHAEPPAAIAQPIRSLERQAVSD